MPYRKYNVRKFKAFTLSEMIVVLLLTVVVVGLSFTVLNLAQKQMGSISRGFENNTEINQLRQALWIDFSTYQKLSFNRVTNVIRCENEVEYVDYVIGKNWIIRERDTFHVELVGKKIYFDGIEFQDGQIDALELLTTDKYGSKTIFVHGKNTAMEYMN